MNNNNGKVADYRILGLKCDVKTCDFEDNTIEFDIKGSQIGRPCPKCGANLLTREAHAHAVHVMAQTAAMNAAAEILRQAGMLPEMTSDEPVVSVATVYDEKGQPVGSRILEEDETANIFGGKAQC